MPTLKELFSECANKFNGIITWDFYQNSITPADCAGMCSSLCAHWIRYHSEDRHLSKELYDKKDPDKLNEIRIGKIQALQDGQLYWLDSDERSFDKAMSKYISWMQSLGLCLQKSVVGGEWTVSYKDTAVDFLVSKNPYTQSHLLASAIIKYISSYLFIVIHSFQFRNVPCRGAGHAVCAWVGQKSRGDVCYFDPNGGEVWFENKYRFFRFAQDYFPYLMMKDGFTEWDIYPVVRGAAPLGR